MTVTEFQQYIISEAKKLLKIEILKEEKNIIEKGLSNRLVTTESKKKLNEGLSEKGVELIKNNIAEIGTRKAAIKLIDYFIKKTLGLSSSDLPDSATFSNGLDEMEEALKNGDYHNAFEIAKSTAQEMISEEGGADLF